MESFVGLSGNIHVHTTQAVMVKSVQADVSDPTTNDVSIQISGSLGTEYNFNAVSPVVGDFLFKYDEQIAISSSGTSLQNVIVNYVFRGDQLSYMSGDPSRVNRPQIGKWKV